jgi:hypothetical protein
VGQLPQPRFSLLAFGDVASNRYDGPVIARLHRLPVYLDTNLRAVFAAPRHFAGLAGSVAGDDCFETQFQVVFLHDLGWAHRQHFFACVTKEFARGCIDFDESHAAAISEGERVGSRVHRNAEAL